MTKLTFLGQNAWWLEIGEHKVLIDPFISGNPIAETSPDDFDPDFILLSHGHGDHVGDTIDIAKRTGAKVITNFEIGNWLMDKGIENVHQQHLGGAFEHAFGTLKLTIAHHGSGLPDGSYGGNPAGLLITTPDEKTLYFACDTALFLDMQLYAEPDVAVLPIGDNFTMGPADAFKAVEMIKPGVAIPCHFNTFEVIEQDGQAWVDAVSEHTDTEGVLLEVGESYEVE